MDIVLAIGVALATTAIFTIPNGMLLWSVPATYLAILLTTATNLGIWAMGAVFASSIVAFASVCLIFAIPRAMVDRVAAVSDQTNKQLEEDVHVLIILLPLISAIMSSYFTALCTM